MDFSSAQISALVGSFFWPFVRIAALLMTMPIIGTQLVPSKIKLLMAVIISSLVVPNLPAMPLVDAISADGVLIVVQQLLIGILMGFALQLVFGALMVGGQVIAMSMGLGFASMTDPLNGISVPAVGQLFVMAATLLFLIMDGHLAVIEVLTESFRLIPIGSTGLEADGFWQLLQWANILFVGAMLMALPTVASVLLVNLAFGVMMKAAPQFNIFSVLFPVTIIFGFFVIMITLPSFLPTFSDMVASVFDLYRDVGIMSR